MTTISADSYDFYVDRSKGRPVILQINDHGRCYRIPMTARTAGDIGTVLLSHAACIS